MHQFISRLKRGIVNDKYSIQLHKAVYIESNHIDLLFPNMFFVY